MASIHFSLRSKIHDKESTVFLRFRDRNHDIKIPLKNLRCKPKDWKDGKCKSATKKMNLSDQDSINVILSKIEAKVLRSYQQDKPDSKIKEWLVVVADLSKTPSNKEVTDEVIPFIDTYISIKKSSVSFRTIQKIRVFKKNVLRYTEYLQKENLNFKKLKFCDLDNNFKENFIIFFTSEQYQLSSIYKDLKIMKMVSKVADSLDLPVNKHVANWSFDLNKATKDNPKSIYLTFQDLEKIEEKAMPQNYLDNAKDWLLISCYTGQRVSDYLRFNSSMIAQEGNGQKYIEFIQKKTNATMRLPLLKKVQEILDKREGEFPRPISDVKLNLYIKEVCKVAELTDQVYNGKVMKITREDGSNITRKVYGTYAKHELVTSHIGRKSFASNFYEIIPTAYLLNFTGHTTEREFLNYINKTDIEKARSTAEIFDKLGY